MPFDCLFHVLATLAAVIALGFVFGRLFKYIDQPPVIGEVVAGIVLGPSLLGSFWPEAMHALIPSREVDPQRQVDAALQTVGQLGVIFYMFLVGLDLNAARLRHRGRMAFIIAQAGIAVPFLLGVGVAVATASRLVEPQVPFVSFALFLGTAMAVTAFPVLARILTDRKLNKTDLGILALSCAAADDVTAWCLLALVSGVSQAQASSAVYIIILSAVYVAVMFLLIRPLIIRIAAKCEDKKTPSAAIPGTFVAVLIAALATEAIGIHGIFGAFLLGAVIPHDSRLAREFTTRTRDLVQTLLLPAFFALTGMNTQIGLLDNATDWLICLSIIAVATLGKFGGVTMAGRLTGLDLQTAAALGTLMNTRGLMELFVLNVGLSLGVISPKLFTMMVLMALATTLTTTPALKRLVPET